MISSRTLLILFSFFCTGVQAQIRIIPLAPENPKPCQKETRASTTVQTLPFWDDFSSPGRPDTNFWQNSEDVFINSGLAFDPPSLYVASFDGLDENGNPYGPGSAEGPADSLTSVPINLSGYTASDNIYLSFFYEFAGLGDKPEPRDSLDLKFRNSAGEWETVWPTASADLDRTGEFKQVLIRIDRNEWLHEGFQMRFQSYGRLSGSFDIWNIDYVYMNANRDFQDRSYPDRTISEPLNAFLGPYHQVPYAHFSAELFTMPSFRVRTLVIGPANQNKAYNYNFNYYITVTDTLDNTTNFSNSIFVEPEESPIASNSSEEVVIREPLPDFGGNEAADSAHILLEVILDADDNTPISEDGDYNPAKYSPIDFQKNDTLRNEYILADSYAYDDGTAELGAGLNTAGDRLAYKYTLTGVEDDMITGMDIYFPFTGNSPDGKQIELTIWQDEGGLPGPTIFRQVVNARLSEEKNKPVRYEFDRPVLLSGTFFIGYRQNSPGALAIGLDVNTIVSDRLFFNLGELWETNSLVQGSLMLRPVFGEVNDIIVGIEDEIRESAPPYPNPIVDGQFYIHTKGSVTITDLRGRQLKFRSTHMGDRVRIMLDSPVPGIYLVHTEGASWKIIIP